jgi:hypothetical protein
MSDAPIVFLSEIGLIDKTAVQNDLRGVAVESRLLGMRPFLYQYFGARCSVANGA